MCQTGKRFKQAQVTKENNLEKLPKSRKGKKGTKRSGRSVELMVVVGGSPLLDT